MSALIIHRRSTIVYFASDQEGGVSVPVPNDAMADMEIINEDRYMQTITSLSAKTHPPLQAVLVLADDMCYFAQATTETLMETLMETRDTLVSLTPFSHVETTVVQSEKQVFVIATNAEVYEAAVRAFENKGISISMVLPWSALVVQKIVLTGNIDKITVRRVMDATPMLKKYAFPFIHHEHTPVLTSEHKPNISSKKKPVGWIIFISASVIYAALMMWFFLIQ